MVMMWTVLLNFVVSVWNQLSQQWLASFGKSDDDENINLGWMQHRGAQYHIVFKADMLFCAEK